MGSELSRRPIWALLAALSALALAICCGLVAAAVFILNDNARRDGTTGTRIEGTIEAACSANGINNVIHCNAQGPSMANVAVEEMPHEGSFWFDGPPEELPTPPANLLTSTESFGWCGDSAFMAWVRSIDRFYLPDIDKEVVLSAGDPDLVTLKRAEVVILNRQPMAARSGTWIKCAFGGGGLVYNHRIEIDSQQLRTNLFDVDGTGGDATENRPRPMPPASVALGEKSEAVVAISAASKPKHAYSGFIVVTTSINGESRRLSLGDRETPLRWTEGSPFEQGDDWYALGNDGHWTKNWSEMCSGSCTN